MQTNRTYSQHELAQMRKENAKVLSKVNLSKEALSNAPKVSQEERDFIVKVTTKAFKKLQADGFISSK